MIRPAASPVSQRGGFAILRGSLAPAGCVVKLAGRFSGAPDGFVVGHICPEAAAGGPIAQVADGDRMRIDVAARRIAHAAPVTAVAFAATGHDLVSGSIDGSLLVARDDHESIALPAFPGGIDAAAILADGRVVASDARSRLRVYDPDRHVLLADLATPTPAMLLRQHPRLRSMLANSRWNLAARCPSRPSAAHRGPLVRTGTPRAISCSPSCRA